MGHAANLLFWKAWEDPRRERPGDFDRNRRTLIVTGKVEVDAETTPMLEEDAVRSGGSEILYLKFNTLKAGDSWKPVWFQKEIKSGDYKEVHLLMGGHLATGGKLSLDPNQA